MARIAVEQSLGEITQALVNQGHEVVALNAGNASNCQCCVISGLDQNMMGISDTITQAPVINARGMSAEEVARQVSERIGKT
ncbi:MAG TPA: YkuS family protein [Bacilli bacterium]